MMTGSSDGSAEPSWKLSLTTALPSGKRAGSRQHLPVLHLVRTRVGHLSRCNATRSGNKLVLAETHLDERLADRIGCRAVRFEGDRSIHSQQVAGRRRDGTGRRSCRSSPPARDDPCRRTWHVERLRRRELLDGNRCRVAGRPSNLDVLRLFNGSHHRDLAPGRARDPEPTRVNVQTAPPPRSCHRRAAPASISACESVSMSPPT